MSMTALCSATQSRGTRTGAGKQVIDYRYIVSVEFSIKLLIYKIYIKIGSTFIYV